MGVRFFDRANRLTALQARAKADLAWTDPDGARLFLWIERPRSDARLTFVLDRAWRVTQAGRTFWCFLDLASGEGQPFAEPVPQFLVLKHVRERVEFPTDRHDGNQSFAECLSRREDGASVFKLVYCSSGGPRAHQEEIRTYLVYFPPNGKAQLAAHDLGREGGSKSGVTGFQDSFELTVLWRSKAAPAPFEVLIRERQDIGETGEGATLPSYTTFRDGVMHGHLPLRKRMSTVEYIESDGAQTLTSVADLLAAYRSPWVTAEWVTPADREEVREAWRSELRRLNPARQPEQLIARGARIVIPTAAFDAAVYEWHRGFVHPTQTCRPGGWQVWRAADPSCYGRSSL